MRWEIWETKRLNLFLVVLCEAKLQGSDQSLEHERMELCFQPWGSLPLTRESPAC